MINCNACFVWSACYLVATLVVKKKLDSVNNVFQPYIIVSEQKFGVESTCQRVIFTSEITPQSNFKKRQKIKPQSQNHKKQKININQAEKNGYPTVTPLKQQCGNQFF